MAPITHVNEDGQEVAARLPVCRAYFDAIELKGARTLKDVRVEISCAEENDMVVYWVRLESWGAMQVIVESPKLYFASEVISFWSNYTGGIPCPLSHQEVIDVTAAEIAAYRGER